MLHVHQQSACSGREGSIQLELGFVNLARKEKTRDAALQKMLGNTAELLSSKRLPFLFNCLEH